MKKLITAIVAAAALTCAAAGAQAAGRTASIKDSLSDKSQIHILYNDKVVEYDDVKPVNTDGRVMIPFRAALENMGASVEYDDAQRKVTATKGDTTIDFTLMDDTIYIDRNGEKSTITMDVPMIIVDDRTLVPIRFMSNALDMQVGWDGDTETVIIMDYDDYFETLDTVAPNLNTITDVKNVIYNKVYDEFKLSLTGSVGEDNISFSLDGSENSEYTDETISINMNSDIGYSANDAAYDIKDVSANIIVKDGAVYVKSNVINKIADATGNIKLKAAALLMSENTWYKLDMYKVIDAMNVSDETKEILKNAFTISSITSYTDVTKQLIQSAENEGDADATLDTAISLAAQFDIIESLDKFVTVTQKDDGGYIMSLNITENDVAEAIANSLGAADNESVKQMITDFLKLNVSVSSEGDSDKAETNTKITLDVNAQDENTKVSISFELGSKSEKSADVQAAQVPEDCTDITTILTDAVGSTGNAQ